MSCCYAQVNEVLDPIGSMKSCPNLLTLMLGRTQNEVLNQLFNESGCRVAHISTTKSYILVSKFQSHFAAVHK